MPKRTFRRFKTCTKLNKRKKRTLKKYGGSNTEKDEIIANLNRKERDIIAKKEKLEASEMELNERKTKRMKIEAQYNEFIADINNIHRALHLIDNENDKEAEIMITIQEDKNRLDLELRTIQEELQRIQEE